jgi:hypothetical protein
LFPTAAVFDAPPGTGLYREAALVPLTTGGQHLKCRILAAQMPKAPNVYAGSGQRRWRFQPPAGSTSLVSFTPDRRPGRRARRQAPERGPARSSPAGWPTTMARRDARPVGSVNGGDRRPVLRRQPCARAVSVTGCRARRCRRRAAAMLRGGGFPGVQVGVAVGLSGGCAGVGVD